MNKNEYIDRAKKLIEEHGIIKLIDYYNFDGKDFCEPYPGDGFESCIGRRGYERKKQFAIKTKSNKPFIISINEYVFGLDVLDHLEEIFDWYLESEDKEFSFYLENDSSSCDAAYYDPEGNLHRDAKTKVTFVRMSGTPLGFACEWICAVLPEEE